MLLGSRTAELYNGRFASGNESLWRQEPSRVVAGQLAQYDRHGGHAGDKLRP